MLNNENIQLTDSGIPESDALMDEELVRSEIDPVVEGLEPVDEPAATEAEPAVGGPEAADEPEAPRKDVLHFDMDSLASYRKGAAAAAVDRPEPRIVLLSDFCVTAHGGSCRRCELACPAQAISIGEDGIPVVDQDACTMCGICLGICDAFTSNDVTMTDLAARMRRVAQRGEGVFVACSQMVKAVGDDLESAQCVVSVPCLAALSPEFWTLALADGLDLKVVCDLGMCDSCELGGGIAEMLYTHAIETAQDWADRQIVVVDEVPVKTGYLESFVIGGEVDRRGVFDHFAGNVASAASGDYRKRNSSVLQDFYERRERMRAQTRQMDNHLAQVRRSETGGTSYKLLQPKRKMLLDAIERDASVAARVPVVVSETDCGRCGNLLACVKACPTHARTAHPENGLLTFDARFCIGCGLCVTACEAGAASLTTRTAEVFAAYSDGAQLVCPEKLSELEEECRLKEEVAKPQIEKICEAD